jgi:hypothetical protein
MFRALGWLLPAHAIHSGFARAIQEILSVHRSEQPFVCRVDTNSPKDVKINAIPIQHVRCVSV